MEGEGGVGRVREVWGGVTSALVLAGFAQPLAVDGRQEAVDRPVGQDGSQSSQEGSQTG